jgi:hypothetical protein
VCLCVSIYVFSTHSRADRSHPPVVAHKPVIAERRKLQDINYN